MREELPFAIFRLSDNEELARAANLLLARQLFRAIAVTYSDDQIQLRQRGRIIETSTPPTEKRP